jgi:prepilin-type N-terminal cleavage/methylation domain-containing protein/prepilin-type processing-associated H-X9-DG protein
MNARPHNPSFTTTHSNGGFTLIEVLVVVAIIALMLAILLPSLAQARGSAQSTICLSNLHQLATAATSYAHNGDGRYPFAYYYPPVTPGSNTMTRYEWDFTRIHDWSTSKTTIKPGLLWHGTTNPEVQQCPAFTGKANSDGDPYTGYNYNTDYIGKGNIETPSQIPVSIEGVRRPAECALFGDGEWSEGANKFMRAPFDDPDNGGSISSARTAGTQGYRHLRKTNVAFCDGHATAWGKRYTKTQTTNSQNKIAANTGFLSPDNSAYDLR